MNGRRACILIILTFDLGLCVSPFRFKIGYVLVVALLVAGAPVNAGPLIYLLPWFPKMLDPKLSAHPLVAEIVGTP